MTTHNEKRIALFVCHDLIGLMIVNELVPKILELGCKPMIVNTGVKRNRRPKVAAPAVPAFYGADIVDKVLLPYLDSRPLQTGPQNLHRSYKQLAELHGLEYHEVADVNDPSFVKKVEEDPRLIGGLAIRFLQIFAPETIKAFESKGFMWNLHGGKLPDYKGLLIPYRAIDNNESTYGWTLHKMAEKIDAGDIIDTTERPLNRLKSVFKTYADMVPYGVTMMHSVLEGFLESGTYQYNPQEASGNNTYYPYPTEAEMDRYNRAGIQFIGDPDAHIGCIVSKFTDSRSADAVNLRRALSLASIEWQRNVHQDGQLPFRDIALRQQEIRPLAA